MRQWVDSRPAWMLALMSTAVFVLLTAIVVSRQPHHGPLLLTSVVSAGSFFALSLPYLRWRKRQQGADDHRR